MAETLLIRADASPEIGTGHVMRCLALAQEWRRGGGRAVFLQAESSPAVRRRLQTEGCELVDLAVKRGSAEDAAATLDCAHSIRPLWVIGDGYCFGSAWQKEIKTAGLRLLVLDDYGRVPRHHADFVLDQNGSAGERLYANRDETTRLLLGSRYTLLRREFLDRRERERAIPPRASRILVTFGGGDPDDVTTMVLEALANLPAAEITAVLGSANANAAKIERRISALHLHCRLVVGADDMAKQMNEADLAVSAAGSTAWELAFMGTPALLIVVADNQVDVAATLHREGVSLSLGEFQSLNPATVAQSVETVAANPERRLEMSRKGRELIDGRGAERVVTRLRAAAIGLRPVQRNDLTLLLEWANDPGVRSSAFNSETIPAATHAEWFQQKLTRADTRMFIGTTAAGEPLGQVRFDWNDTAVAEIDVSVKNEARKSGIGPALIRRAVDELFATTPATTVKALIRPENHASRRAFEKAGFLTIGHTVAHGNDAVCMEVQAHD